MRIFGKALLCLTAVLFMGSALAQPTRSYLEYRSHMMTGPDEYLLFSQERKQVVDYNEERIVRICAGDSAVVTPLTINFDERSTELQPGDCIRVEAKSVFIEPAERLEPNTMLKIQVDTINP